jgi:hypothetical protein
LAANRRSRRTAAALERQAAPEAKTVAVLRQDSVGSIHVKAIDGMFVLRLEVDRQAFVFRLTPDAGAQHLAECLAVMEQLDAPPPPVPPSPAGEALLAEALERFKVDDR